MPAMNPEGATHETRRKLFWRRVSMCFLCAVVTTTAQAQTARIKRISLMTPDLDRSIEFFTEVVGFTLDFEGTLPPGGEPFLGPVFNIDVSRPIRRALLSTETEPRGLFLIEHPRSPRADDRQPTAVVTVVQVSHIEQTLARAQAFGAPVSETVTDVTPEGVPFSEAMITSPGGHAILVYQVGESSEP